MAISINEVKNKIDNLKLIRNNDFKRNELISEIRDDFVKLQQGQASKNLVFKDKYKIEKLLKTFQKTITEEVEEENEPLLQNNNTSNISTITQSSLIQDEDTVEHLRKLNKQTMSVQSLFSDLRKIVDDQCEQVSSLEDNLLNLAEGGHLGKANTEIVTFKRNYEQGVVQKVVLLCALIILMFIFYTYRLYI